MSTTDRGLKLPHVLNILHSNYQDKGTCQEWHFKKRFRERTGIICTDEVYNKFRKNVRQGRSKFVLKETNRIKHFLDYYENRPVIIVFDSFRESLVTILFEDMFDKEQIDLITKIEKKHRRSR
jgi:hypothetical protein